MIHAQPLLIKAWADLAEKCRSALEAQRDEAASQQARDALAEAHLMFHAMALEAIPFGETKPAAQLGAEFLHELTKMVRSKVEHMTTEGGDQVCPWPDQNGMPLWCACLPEERCDPGASSLTKRISECRPDLIQTITDALDVDE